jgi:hypothetical protein
MLREVPHRVPDEMLEKVYAYINADRDNRPTAQPAAEAPANTFQGDERDEKQQGRPHISGAAIVRQHNVDDELHSILHCDGTEARTHYKKCQPSELPRSSPYITCQKNQRAIGYWRPPARHGISARKRAR